MLGEHAPEIKNLTRIVLATNIFRVEPEQTQVFRDRIPRNLVGISINPVGGQLPPPARYEYHRP